jgi:hypothetical protein
MRFFGVKWSLNEIFWSKLIQYNIIECLTAEKGI